MNYERIILELMERIQVLEEKVSALENRITTEEEAGEKVSLTDSAREYIRTEKRRAREAGQSEVILVCNDIQKQMGVINRAPAICRAMYDCMEAGDVVLYAPSSGKSTAVKIKYCVHD